MNFALPIMLFLAALVPLLALWWMYLKARKDKALGKVVAPHLKSRLMPKGKDYWGVQSALIVSGIILALIAAARPQWGRSDEKQVERSRNVVVAIDVSRSMLAEDVRPNRLERSKADVADLIDSLNGDRAALVAFRHQGVVVCPLTTDLAFLRSSLEQIAPESAPRGETDLGGAIRASLQALDPAADNHNAIILISDGGDLKGEVVEAAQIAKERGIPVFTVGIGDPNRGSTILSDDGTVMKFEGKPVEVRLEEAALKSIAEVTNARYVPLATAGTAETTLGAIYQRFLRQVAAQEQNEIESKTAERYQVFLYPALVCLFSGAAFSKGRFKRRTRA